MPLPKQYSCSIKDIYALPEGQRAELIDGTMYAMAPPSRVHQKLVSELHYQIKDYIRKKGGFCEVYPAPFAVCLNADDRNYVEPDISVICDKSRLTDQGCTGAPDWIIEIVSPSTQTRDYGIKLFKYRMSGVREYWIVNPMKEIVNVYDFENDQAAGVYSFDEYVPAALYPEFQIRLSDLL